MPSVLRYHMTGSRTAVINPQITTRRAENSAAVAWGNVRAKPGCISFNVAAARLQKMSAML